VHRTWGLVELAMIDGGLGDPTRGTAEAVVDRIDSGGGGDWTLQAALRVDEQCVGNSQ
jgi:hypothetical protein